MPIIGWQKLIAMEHREQARRDTNGSRQILDGDPSSREGQQRNRTWDVLGIKRWNYWMLVGISYLAMSVGMCAANLLSRFYFAEGGSRRWISTWLQSVGFPVLFLPLIVCYRGRSARPFDSLTPRMMFICCGMGVLLGLDNLMYAWGISYLSVSTSSLLLSSQLAFNSIFALLIVRQKFGSHTVNSVVLLTLSSALVGFGSNKDEVKGVSRGQYVVGILTTIGAAALYGLILPLMELIYAIMKCRMTYVVVLEMQVIISATATAFSAVGMLVNGDFQAMNREASRVFAVGELKYYMTIVWTSVSWQLFFAGSGGLIFLTTSLVSGILMTALLPVTLIGSVIFFHDNFNGDKVVAVVLSLWGFTSYLYGQYRDQHQQQQKHLEGRANDPDDNNKQLDLSVDDAVSIDL